MLGHPSLNRVGAAALAALLLTPLSVAVAQPSLTTAQPGGAAPGQTIEMTLQGGKFAEPLTFWTSFGGKVEVIPEMGADGKPAPVKPDRATVRCRVSIPAEAVVGVGGIVAATPEGASEPLCILIDDLPSVADNGANRSFETAQEIALPAAVDGLGDGTVSDFYKFTAKAGQRLAVEAVAARLGSPFDPLLRLLDATGAELRFADDDPSLGADCRFAHTFDKDGVYVLEVADVRYRGGAGFRYRLRIGDFPLVSTAYPLGGKAGETAQVTFAGPEASTALPIPAPLATSSPGGLRQIAFKPAGAQGSGWTVMAVDELPQAIEAEPNNEPAQASPLTAPLAISGHFQAPGDVDHFRITAKKDQPLAIIARTAPLGSPGRVMLRVCSADGATLGQAGGSGEGVESLAFAPPADGDYLIVAEELLRRGGPDCTYRIEVRPQRPAFSLALKSDATGRKNFIADGGGAITVDLVCNRTSYNDPIELSVEGLAGAAIRNPTIPAGAKEYKALIDLPAGATPGQVATLRLFGKGGEQRELVRSAALVKTKIAALAPLPPWLDGELFVAATAAATAPYQVQPDKPSLVVAKSGRGAASLKIERKDANFKAPLQVFVDGLPAGLKAEVKQTGKDKDEAYEIALIGAADLAEGDHGATVALYGEHGGRVFKTALPLAVKAVTPLAVSWSAAGPLAKGAKQKAKISLRRFLGQGADPAASVKLKFVNLPAGVVGPGEIALTAPAEQLELEVELSATADAAPAKVENVQVEAISQFAGHESRAVSAAGVLEIVAQ